MPSDSPFAQLAWLDRRQRSNRIRRFLSKPRNAAVVLLFVVYALFLVGFVGLFVGKMLGGPPLRPAHVDVPMAAGFLTLVLGYAAFLGVVLGWAQLVDADPFLVGVFASPIDGGAIVRYRVRRMLLYAGGAAIAFSLALAVVLTKAVVLPIGPTILRVGAVVVPTTLTWVLVGFLGSIAHRRWGDRGGDALVGALGIGVIALAAWLVAPGSDAPARLSAAVVAIAGPAVRWMLALPIGAWGMVELVAPWVAAVGLGGIASRVQYPVPGSSRPVALQTGYALGPEVAPKDDWSTRLRRRLRFRYRDLGPGPRALSGEVVTLSLRHGDLVLGGIVLGPLVYLEALLLWLDAGTGAVPGRFLFALFALGFGTWFGAFMLRTMGAPYRSLLAEQVRQLPISGRAALEGLFASKRWMIAAIAGLVGLGMGISFRDPLLAVLSGTLTASTLWLVAMLSLWGAPYVRPPNAPAGEGNVVPSLVGALGSVLVLGGESALGLLLPSPNAWNPLWLPFAISTGINLAAIWRLRPVLARRVGAPARE